MSTRKSRIYEEFAKRLRDLIRAHYGVEPESHGVRSSIAKYCDVTHRAVRRWVDGEAMPDQAHGVLLARLLRCSYEKLMAGTTPSLTMPESTDEIDAIVEMMMQIDQACRDHGGEVDARNRRNILRHLYLRWKKDGRLATAGEIADYISLLS
jgi:hypothetical protein